MDTPLRRLQAMLETHATAGTPPDEEETLARLLELVEAVPAFESDLRARMVAAWAMGTLCAARPDDAAHWCATVELTRAVHEVHPELTAPALREALAGPAGAGEPWTALSASLLRAAERGGSRRLRDGGVAIARRALEAACAGAHPEAPAPGMTLLELGGALFDSGIATADLAALAAAEAAARAGIGTGPSPPVHLQLLELRWSTACARVALADPDVEVGGPDAPAPSDDTYERATIAAHERLARAAPQTLLAWMKNRRPGDPSALAEAAAAAGDLHWRRFLALRGAGDPMRGTRVVMTTFDGEETFDCAIELPGDADAASAVNGALATYSLAVEELPERVPDALRRTCEYVVRCGHAMAELALRRAVDLLNAGGATEAREAVSKLARSAAARFVTPDGRDLLAVLLGDALVCVHRFDGDPRALATAVRLLRRAAGSGRSDRARACRNLAAALALSGGGDDELLDEAIGLLRSVVAQDAQPEDVANLGARLYDRHRRTGGDEELREAIALLRAAVAEGLPHAHDVRRATLQLAAMIARTGDPGSGAEALSLLERLVARTPPPGYDWEHDARALADAVCTHGDAAAHRRAVALLRAAPDTPARRSAVLYYGAQAPYCEEPLIALLRASLAALPPGHLDESRAHLVLARALATRCRASRDPHDAAGAKAHHRAGRARLPGTASALWALSGSAEALWKAFEATGDRELLELAFEGIERALDAADPDASTYRATLVRYVNVATTVAEETSDDAPLAGALPRLRAALAADADCDELLGLLAMALHQLWHRDDTVDLNEALTVARRAVELATSPPRRAATLNNLGYLLLDAYRATADPDLLAEAVMVGRNAVRCDLSHGGEPDADSCLAHLNLGAALLRRGISAGDNAATREAVTCLRAAAAASVGSAHHPVVLGTLGIGLLQAARTREELLGAVEVLERCVAVTPPRHQMRVVHLLNLSQGLLGAFRATGDETLLDRAVEVGDSALAPDHHGRQPAPRFLLGVATLHRERMTRSAPDDGARRVLELLDAAIRQEPSGDVLARALHMHGEVLSEVAARTSDARLRASAVDAFRSAAEIESAPAHDRAGAAWAWGHAAAQLGRPAAALEAFALVVSLLETAAEPALGGVDQERSLSRFAGAARIAAAYALDCGEPERAVELLEQGRGVLLGRRLAARSRLEELRMVAPELADAFARVSAALDAASDVFGFELVAEPALDTARRVHLAQERSVLLRRIRALAGFEDFLTTPRFEALRRAAARGPVAIVNVSSLRCDALIVTARGVRVVPLPALREAEVASRAEWFVGAVALLGSEGGTVDLSVALAGRSVVIDVLRWLWDAIAEPVLAALGYDAAAQCPPRMWWCPTGDLCLLPLHAAGHPPHPDGREVPAVVDRVVSSYAPTLRALVPGAGPPDDGDERDGALLVAVARAPYATHREPLDVDSDIEAFVARFPDGRILRQEEALAERVFAELRDASIVHLACHARQRIDAPSEGVVEFWDRPVAARELRQPAAAHGRLAILLGCETARGGRQLADEAVTLASAFQLAGYAHSVGALWPIDDADAGAVAARVYAALPRSGSQDAGAWSPEYGDATARAVHAAVHALRKRFPLAPSRWAAFVHTGP